MSMEEGFFLYRVALDAADIAPWHIESPTPVVANLANAGLAVRDLATVLAGKTPHPVAVKLFVQFAPANVFMNDFAQPTHTCQVSCLGGSLRLETDWGAGGAGSGAGSGAGCGIGSGCGIGCCGSLTFCLLACQKFYGGFSYIPLIHLEGDVQ